MEFANIESTVILRSFVHEYHLQFLPRSGREVEKWAYWLPFACPSVFVQVELENHYTNLHKM
jgi:hypothetical protein